jgi:signal transduction histidine kinase
MGGPGMHRAPHEGFALFAQVQLTDGTWATFDSQLPPSSASLPWRLLLTLLVLLAAVLLISWLAVRWITRPLQFLASAADELGRNINRPPLPETGPVEVSRAARAFNTMQSRLVRLIEDRTRLLAAMSHDLKTPITRMRLRAELLDDDATRAKFDSDLREMESMVGETLDFMRGLGAREPAQPIDVIALLESLQSDYEAMGRAVTVAGRADAPFSGMPSQLKRCLVIDRQRDALRQARRHRDQDAPAADHPHPRPARSHDANRSSIRWSRLNAPQPGYRRHRPGPVDRPRHRPRARGRRAPRQPPGGRIGGYPHAGPRMRRATPRVHQ